MKTAVVRKSFDLKVTSDFLYSINFGTSVTKDVEYETPDELKKKEENLASHVKSSTRKDAGKMLTGLKAVLAAQPESHYAGDPVAQVMNSIQSLVTRMEAIGIQSE